MFRCCFEEGCVVDPESKKLLLDLATFTKGSAQVLTEGLAIVDTMPSLVLLDPKDHKAARERRFPRQVLQKAFTVSIMDANASVADDWLQIVACLAKQTIKPGSSAAELKVAWDSAKSDREREQWFETQGWGTDAQQNLALTNSALRSLLAEAGMLSMLQSGRLEEALDHLAAAPQRKHLAVHLGQPGSDHALREAGSQKLATVLSSFPNLQTLSLNLSNNFLCSAGMAAIASGIGQCTHIQELVLMLRTCNIGNEGATALGCALQQLVHLRCFEADMGRGFETDAPSIGSEGIAAIGSALGQCPRLESLGMNLFANYVERGIAALQPAIRQTKCGHVVLYLSGCGIDEHAAGALGAMFSGCTQLQRLRLNLSSNPLNTAGAAHILSGIAACSNLDIVDLNFHGTQVDMENDILSPLLSELKSCVRAVMINVMRNWNHYYEEFSASSLFAEKIFEVCNNPETNINRTIQGVLDYKPPKPFPPWWMTSSEMNATFTVRRLREECSMVMHAIEVGDIIQLSAGDVVPGDCRLVNGSCSANMWQITGDSRLQKRDSEEETKDLIHPMIEARNMLPHGTIICKIDNGTYVEAEVVAAACDSKLTEICSAASDPNAKDGCLLDQLLAAPKILELQKLAVQFPGLVTRHEMAFVRAMLTTAVVFEIPEILAQPSYSIMQVAYGSGNQTIVCADPSDSTSELPTTLIRAAAMFCPIEGNAIDHAIHSFATTAFPVVFDEELESYLEKLPPKVLLPFSSSTKMAVTGAGDIVVVKGAPERVMDCCATIQLAHSDIVPLTTRLRQQLNQEYEKMGTLGLRCLGVAQKQRDFDADFSIDDAQELTFLGIVGVGTPLAAGVQHAVKRLKAIGLKLAIASGQHPVTVKAIASSAGVIGPEQKVVGAPFGEEDWDAFVASESPAGGRLSGRLKSRLVCSLEEQGHKVCVVGADFQDLPMLASAWFAVAVANATAISKSASHCVLTGNLCALVDFIESAKKRKNDFELDDPAKGQFLDIRDYMQLVVPEKIPSLVKGFMGH